MVLEGCVVLEMLEGVCGARRVCGARDVRGSVWC